MESEDPQDWGDLVFVENRGHFYAVYMGVPVLTLYSERRSTRFGYSVLKTLGVDHLAVNNVKDYVERAVGLANDKEALDALHKSLRNMLNQAAAFNSTNYVRALESQYEKILSE